MLQDVNLQLVSFPLACPAWCLVQDNLALTRQGAEAEIWLLDQLLPSLYEAGVRHWIWVCSPTLRSHSLVKQVAKRLPSATLTIFDDLEHATTWLQYVR